LTPEVEHKRNPQIDPKCKICRNGGFDFTDSMAHRLNGCRTQGTKYLWRHNLLESTLTNAIQEQYKDVIIAHSRTMRSFSEDIPDELKDLKPDLWFVDPDNGTIFIVEISVPYPTTSDRANQNNEQIGSLKTVRETKINKYKPLKQFFETTLQVEVKLITAITSSIGTTSQETIDDIRKLLPDKSRANRTIKKMEYDAIIGSASIFYRTKAHVFGDGRDSPFDIETPEEQPNNENANANPNVNENPNVNANLNQNLNQPEQIVENETNVPQNIIVNRDADIQNNDNANVDLIQNNQQHPNEIPAEQNQSENENSLNSPNSTNATIVPDEPENTESIPPIETMDLDQPIERDEIEIPTNPETPTPEESSTPRKSSKPSVWSKPPNEPRVIREPRFNESGPSGKN
jgi:hypothetical protein